MATKTSVVNIDPEIMSGAPVFMGTRVTIQTLIDHIAAGDSIDRFLEGFPTVKREQVVQFLDESAAALIAKADTCATTV